MGSGLFAFPDLILDIFLYIAITGLKSASRFLQLPFLFQARFACNLAGSFLYSAFRFPDTTFDLIFVHHALLLFIRFFLSGMSDIALDGAASSAGHPNAITV
jgi:hypothetical protein